MKENIELGVLNIEKMLNVAKSFAQCLSDGDVVLLIGPLGSGKTTFTKGIVKGLGGDDRLVTSPTYTLVNIYNAEKTVFHVDAYRVENPEDMFYLIEGELEDNEGIFVIEWGNLVEDNFEDAIKIYFEYDGLDSRRIRIECGDNAKVEQIRRGLENG